MSYNYVNLCSKICEISEKSFYRWKSKDHVVLVNLIESYFSKEDLENFLETGKIDKFDYLSEIQSLVIVNSCNKYINTFVQKTNSSTLKYTSSYFIDFYFTFLSEFNKFEKDKKFSSKFNDFLIEYILKNKDQDKLKEISRYLFLLNDWDELMSIFLNLNLDSNLSILLIEIDDAFNNKINKEEIYFHIIGLYVYYNHSSLSSLLKIELIKNLHDEMKDEFYTYYLLIQHINEVELERINSLKELGFDKSLY